MGTKENRNGEVNVKAFVRSVPNRIEYIGRSITILSIALWLIGILGFQREFAFTKLAVYNSTQASHPLIYGDAADSYKIKEKAIPIIRRG